MRTGADSASTSPSPAQLKKARVSFVCRYVSSPGNPKNLTHAEATRLLAGGIDIVVVFETTAGRALAGAAAGAQDARSAVAQAKACGAPAGSAIYFAVDFDATPAQQKKINGYLLGASAVLGKSRIGVYGGYYVVKRALDAGLCNYAWQTRAWSGGQWDSRAHLRQLSGGKIGGVSVDFNQAMFADFGQWRTAAPKPAPTPAPVPAPKPKPKPKPKPIRWIYWIQQHLFKGRWITELMRRKA